MKQFFKKHSKSFTIIELIIAVSIIIILSVIVIGNYEWGGYEVELEQSTQKVTQDISNLREKAMASSPDDPPYGIYFGVSTSTYIIFKDLNRDGEYTKGTGEEEKVLSLGEGVFFESTACDPETGVCQAPGDISLSFIPPEPIVKIIFGEEEQSLVKITLRSRKSDSTSSIWVSKSGLIEAR